MNASRLVEAAWKWATIEFNKLSFKDIIIKRSLSTFNEDQYYSPEYSYWLMLCLLKMQGMSADDIQSFFAMIPLWADRKLPKQNSLYFIGGPGAGKSFLLNSLLTLMWNVGHIINPSKYSTFEFDNCQHRRVLVWPEAAIASDKCDMAKELMEGQDITVAKKYENNVIIQGTPLIIHGNRPLWATHNQNASIFLQRCLYFTWSSQAWLKNCLKKPHPLWWSYIFNYKLIEYDCIPEFTFFNDYTNCNEIIFIQEKPINKYN